MKSRSYLRRYGLALAGLSLLLAAPAAAARRKGPMVMEVDAAAEKIGRHVYVALGPSMPPDLMPWMRSFAKERKGRTNVYYMSTFASGKNFAPEVLDKWHPHLFFTSPGNREIASQGLATLHRGSLFELSRRIDKGDFPLDTVVVRVSPPDKDGNVSLGTTGDLTLHAIKQVQKRGGKIIAEVNPNVPFTKGNLMPYQDLSIVFESDQGLGEHNAALAMGTEKAISRNVAALIPKRRRFNLQVGIGNAITEVGNALVERAGDQAVAGKAARGWKKRTLRGTIWSEMGSDWVIPLMGGAKPLIKEGTFSFLLGTKNLYALADNHPGITIGSTGEVNDPAVAAKRKRLRAVNTALEVDVLGNVNAERIGDRIISFPGGQPDFMEAAATAKDGRAILALRSTAKGGVSTIVMDLNGKGTITTPAKHVDHVVTEWGTTKQLRHLSDSARVYEIIKVASPVHRVGLAQAAQAKGLLSEKQVQKVGRSVFHALRLADPSILQETNVAQQAKDQGLITADQFQQVMAGVGPVAQQH